jgi:L-fuculose-phosphate aldolase
MTKSNEAKIARHLADVCHWLYQKGFVTATDGNVSARLRNGNILTTPTSINKGRVTEADLVEVTLQGEAVVAPETFYGAGDASVHLPAAE